jgi:hypothetical protein
MLNFLPAFPHLPRRNTLIRLAQCLLLALAPWNAALAKDVPVTGIMVYGAPGKLAYVQVTGFLVNGKTELRACSGSGGIDKSAYKNLAKINLESLTSLERLPDGSMVASVNDATPTCVVPSNFKWDKENSLTQSDLVEKSTYAGQVVGSSSPAQAALPPFAAGTKFVFGNASDKELAEYVLADRAKSIAVWQSFLPQFPAGAHLIQAKASLSALLLADGNEKLNRYKASRSGASPAYDALRDAHDRYVQALDLQGSNDAAAKLRDAVTAELKTVTDSASAKLQGFRDATAAHTAGYPLLVAAKDLSDHVTAVDPKYAPGVALASSVGTDIHALDAVAQTAAAQDASKQYDAAYTTIGKYLSFAGEEPRLKQVVATDYKYHFDKGGAEAASNDWAGAVVDLKRANEITATDEAKSALVNAQASLLAAQNKDAADKALATSKQHAGDNDTIGAYEVLANLTDGQRPLVKDDMTALQDAYVLAATAKANELQLAHTPIHGRADEDAIRQAYDYMQRASKLSDNNEIALKLELMAETISNYYVEVAGKYLNKPLSSGVGLGWSYLNEASQYRPNLDVVRDAMTSNTAAYQMRARLSIGVVFRDQTSRRDSAGFADQLQQAFATGLETSGLPVRVVLPGAPGALEPNFQFVGEILQHRVIRNAKKDTLQSQYRSGSREIPNEAWNKADQTYEAALLDLQKAQGELTAAQTKNNKKMMDSAEKDISTAQDTVQQARSKMNSTPKTLSDDVVSPYNYTRTTLELTNIVELSFRIIDSAGNIVGEPIHVIKGDQPRKFVILENIKPDDTQGIKEIDSQPDETQLMTDVEIEARDTMVKAARDKVQELPDKILAQARAKATSNDLDGAGESYVLYLNCTPAASTPDRIEAVRFLNDNFNIRNTVNLRASAQ